MNAPRYGAPVGRVDAYPQNDRYSAPPSFGRGPAASGSQDVSPLPRLGPSQGNPVNAFGPVAVTPTATLACPIVSALDRWLADSVQPSAMRWFGARVVEIKQISAYSCRGMNGNSRAHISEHAFGNALDIAAFTLADGRRITVKDGWKGMPEEQGFLRDVQGAACQQFNTVLAPGSNVYHYDHIHVDLMRRASRRIICQPAAVSGEEIASRASQRNSYASREPSVTGSLGGRHKLSHRSRGSTKKTNSWTSRLGPSFRDARSSRADPESRDWLVTAGFRVRAEEARPGMTGMSQVDEPLQKIVNDAAQQIELVPRHRQRPRSGGRLPRGIRQCLPNSPARPARQPRTPTRRSGTGAIPPAAMRMNWNAPPETTARAHTSTSGHSAWLRLMARL